LLPSSLVFKNPSSVFDFAGADPCRLLEDDDRLGLRRADDDRLRDFVDSPPSSVVEEGTRASPPEDIVDRVGWRFFFLVA